MSTNPTGIALSNTDLEKLTGHLLGDGTLYFTKPSRKYPVFQLNSHYPEYAAWVAESLDFMQDRKVSEYAIYDERTKKTYTGALVKSVSSQDLLDQHSRWYNNSKDVPHDLELSPETCLRWYLDDGSIGTKGGLYFATDSFSLAGVELLREKLKALGFKTSKHLNGADRYRVYLWKSSTRSFLDYIGPCPVKCYEYKWDIG